MGVEFSGSFEINGDLYFQPLRGGKLAFFNGDVPLKPNELNPFIDALLANGLTFQAMHQHYFDLTPMYWFIHFRGVAAPLTLAKAVNGALDATAIPFPQKGPEKPSTPFDARRLAKILHGTVTVGEDGVVTVDISRKGRIVIDGVEVNPDANLSTNVQFKPLGKGGNGAAAAPDFSFTSSEVTPVVSMMRGAGWQVHCLYNAETAESPQLYFSHMQKTSDVYELATEIRKGARPDARGLSGFDGPVAFGPDDDRRRPVLHHTRSEAANSDRSSDRETGTVQGARAGASSAACRQIALDSKKVRPSSSSSTGTRPSGWRARCRTPLSPSLETISSS
jgi:hypothetical protein